MLASPFQTEQLTRLGGTGVPLSLGDVLPALQQGTLDGALGALPVFTALQYYDSAKYMTETGHAYIFSTAWLSKRWFDALPADLKADRARHQQAGRRRGGSLVAWISWCSSARSGSTRVARSSTCRPPTRPS